MIVHIINDSSISITVPVDIPLQAAAMAWQRVLNTSYGYTYNEFNGRTLTIRHYTPVNINEVKTILVSVLKSYGPVIVMDDRPNSIISSIDNDSLDVSQVSSTMIDYYIKYAKENNKEVALKQLEKLKTKCI